MEEAAAPNSQNQKQNNNGIIGGVVDTSAPFKSVMEAVTRFGGIGFWKPQTNFQHSQTIDQQVSDAEDQPTTQLPNDPSTEERETIEILKELEATITRFQQLKVKLQKEAEPNITKVQVDEVELSKTEILKRVEEATEQVTHCTRVLEQLLGRVEAARNRTNSYSDCKMLLSVPTMSIGQILSRKLVMAEERSDKSGKRWMVAQILSKGGSREKRGGGGGDLGGEKGAQAKRRNFGFGGMSFLVAKQGTKKTKKHGR